MKKIAMVAVAAMVAGAVFADLTVEWNSQGGAVEATSGGNDFLTGVRIDLVYSVAGAITAGGQYDVGGVDGLLTETVLRTGVNNAGSPGLWALGSETHVGDFTGGLFFTRIFESTGAAGESFLDIPMAAGADWVYNAVDPLSVYKADVVSGVQFVGQNGTTTVIPEPATLGLMGIAGLGMFLARKKAKR